MFEILRIKLFGTEPAAKITDRKLEQLIHRDFGKHEDEVKQKLEHLNNRIAAAILKLSNKDINSMDHFIEVSNDDYRDVLSSAEYPRYGNMIFGQLNKKDRKRIILEDWQEYSEWLK